MLEPRSRQRDLHEQRSTALTWYQRFINNRIHRVFPIPEQERLQGDDIIYSLQDRQAAYDQRQADLLEERETNWRDSMRQDFTQNRTQISRLSVWILNNWDAMLDTSSGLGEAAFQTGWGVLDSQERGTSVLAVSRPSTSEQQRGIELGRNYFLDIHRRYGGAFQTLFVEATALQQSLFGGTGSIAQDAFDYLEKRRPHWQTLRDTLIRTNRRRLRALGFCWTDFWNHEDGSCAAPHRNSYLRVAGIEIATSGGWSVSPVEMEQ